MTNDDPDVVPEPALISEAKRYAAQWHLLLEHPKVKARNGDTGFYVTALTLCETILRLTQESEHCSSAEEFDVLLYLICCQTESLERTISLLRIP